MAQRVRDMQKVVVRERERDKRRKVTSEKYT
jgi:hypothetical protein